VDASLRLLTEGVAIKPITPDIAALATQFPDDYSYDPADRLIGATARAEVYLSSPETKTFAEAHC